MPDKDTDRRIIKTRKIINEAFVELMREKHYDKITVQDVIDRANVGRSTFYAHYSTKDDLLRNSIESIMVMLDQHFLLSASDEGRGELIPVAEFFKHVKENSRLIKSFMSGNSTDAFAEKIQSSLNKKIDAHLRLFLNPENEPTVPVPIIVNYISSTLIFLLKWWIDNKMKYSPVQMEQYFNDLVIPSVRSVFQAAIQEPVQ
jgi:AcrR family transcriptional regulator